MKNILNNFIAPVLMLITIITGGTALFTQKLFCFNICTISTFLLFILCFILLKTDKKNV